MFIAMNRFRIVKGEEAEFERIWAERETHLAEVPGFVEFHLLRGPELEDHSLYISHTEWENEDNFTDWTNSDAFRKAHAKAGDSSKKSVYMGRPQFEGFTSVQTVGG
ncbi:MAG: antibiotic biosynthesis monooxygenase [Rhodospirillaceae bacterium]|nr:MAG: antibiotic biosynthesis monooxygenase [Rhodospirillaceae bacterium]